MKRGAKKVHIPRTRKIMLGKSWGRKMERREHGHLLSKHVAAIMRWVGNLRIVDRRITRNDQSWINQRSSSQQVRELGFKQHLVSPRDGRERVQKRMKAHSRWTEIKRNTTEKEKEISDPFSLLLSLFFLILSIDFALSKPQAALQRSSHHIIRCNRVNIVTYLLPRGICFRFICCSIVILNHSY